MNPEEIKIWKSYRSHQIKQLIKMLRQHWGNQVFKLKVESVIWHLATVRNQGLQCSTQRVTGDKLNAECRPARVKCRLQTTDVLKVYCTDISIINC